MSESLPPLLTQALDITERASSIPVKTFGAVLDVDIKADESPVTRADRETEAFIRREITSLFPEDGIFGEEYGVSGLDRKRVWVCDPIDGTKSFITGVPLFGMLLALIEDGQPALGIVRLPALAQVYSGGRGLPAKKNDALISCSKCRTLAEAIIFINEAEKIYNAEPTLFSKLVTAGRLRRIGYDCLPHMLVAEGRVDAAIDYDLKPYDYLPLIGVVEAAGGVITDWNGNPLNFESDGRVVTAATPELHRELLTFLKN